MPSRKNAFDVVRDFEEAMREYTGAHFACAVDSCTMALFLCFTWLMEQRKALPPSNLPHDHTIQIPQRTFISVPSMAVHAGWNIRWIDDTVWSNNGYYHMPVVRNRIDGDERKWPCIVDSALMLERDHHIRLATMARADGDPIPFVCLSFQYRKHLPIGRGGMILCNDPLADEWFRRARFFGRAEVPAKEDPGPTMLGWHGYMEPERAAKGLSLLMHLPDRNKPLRINYPDLYKYQIFNDVS